MTKAGALAIISAVRGLWRRLHRSGCRVHDDRKGSARRMAQRHHALLPEASGMAGFIGWLAHHQERVGMEDAESLYLDVCELAGWINAPPFDVGIMERHGSAVISPPVAIKRRAALSADVAAREFLVWVERHRRNGAYALADLAALYAAHADEINVTPTPTDALIKSLASLGVEKKRRTIAAGARGSRTVMMWTLSAQALCAQSDLNGSRNDRDAPANAVVPNSGGHQLSSAPLLMKAQ